MRTVAVFLSFAFVSEIFGQTYIGRPRPDIKPVVPLPKPIIHAGSMGMSGGLVGLQGGGMLPPHIQSIIGSTLNGGDFIGGINGLPRHGGAGIGEEFATGLRNGWGADPNMPVVQAVSSWVDPLNGHDFPHDYTGGELFFDNTLRRYVARQQQHDMAKSVGAVPVGGQVLHDAAKMSGAVGPMMSGQMQHDISKATSGMALSPLGNPIGHNMVKAEVQHDMAKATGGMMIPVNPLHPAGSNPIQHNMVKAEVQHDIAKSSGGVLPMGTPIFGGVHSPMVAGQIQHDIAKASSGMGGMGMINPGVQHDIAKASSGMGMIGGGVMDPFGHDIAKASSGVHVMDPIGMGMSSIAAGKPTFNNPVHNVDKAGASGIPAIGHDPLAAQIGHGIAKQTIRESAQIVDMGTGGAVSMGNPLAASATHGLAKEAVHVAGKTLGVASGAGPAVSAISMQRITGYQGRQRDPIVPPGMKQW